MNDPVDSLVVALIFFAAIVGMGFFAVVVTLTKTGKGIRMGLTELTAAAQGVVDQGAALVTEIGTVGQSVTDEITRVEKAIADAKANGVDPATLDPITASLNTAKANLAAGLAALQSSQAALDSEQAPPAVALTA